MTPSVLLSAGAFAGVPIAGAFLYDLAQSDWGERHPRLRELALLFAFIVGAAMLAAIVMLPGWLIWTLISSAPTAPTPYPALTG